MTNKMGQAKLFVGLGNYKELLQSSSFWIKSSAFFVRIWGTAYIPSLFFGIFIANEAAEENKKKERKNDNKYLYEIDISSALKTARKFFIRRDSDKPIDIIKLMLKYVHAVKEKFRQFDRPLRGISAIHFGYR